MHARKPKFKHAQWRLQTLRVFFFLFAGIILFRLFTLQIVNAGFYASLASGQHDMYQELIAERGTIFVRDWKDGTEYAAATNEAQAFVYADPRKIEDPEAVTKALAGIFSYELPSEGEDEGEDANDQSEQPDDALAAALDGDEQQVEGQQEQVDDVATEEEVGEQKEDDGPLPYELLLERLSKENDPYEPIERHVPEEVLDRILALDIDGIGYVLEEVRSYPETSLGGHVFGFVSKSEEQSIGQYGVEGFYNDFLAGVNGFLHAQTDSVGRWIGVGRREFEEAKDGGDILLTIDRTIQHTACNALKRGVERYQADGGSLIIIEPSTGRIMAMCNEPDFDPNTYNEVENIAVYNNDSIFTAYEPGSVMKPLVMAGAVDVGAVSPSTTYTDEGEEKIEEYTIRNSDLKSHGLQTMTQVLEKSLNTGMIYVMRRMGGETMARYYEDFGFGTLTGIDLDTESSGNIQSLYNDHEIYYATASYGQGITATPLQLATAYAALANGGEMMQPYIVEERRYADGTVEHLSPRTIRQVVDKSTATTIGAMMVSVIENGHAEAAGVDGYYIAGKTGTAQVAEGGQYVEGVTNATFTGFGPIEDPKYAMVVKIERPRTTPWASDTAAPIFGEVSDFLLQYLEVPPTRE